MSAYGKSTQAGFLDYDTTRVPHDPMSYPGYAQPPYLSNLLPQHLAGHPSDAENLQYLPHQPYSSGGPYEMPRQPIVDVRSRQLPEITSFSPQRGPEGSKVFVYFQSTGDFLSQPTTFTLSFGSKRCNCILECFGLRESTFQYAIAAETPSFISTGCPSLAVPLQMMVDSQMIPEPVVIQVGVFTYESSSGYASDDSRKRKMSMSTVSEESVPRKRASAQQLRIKEPATETYQYNDNLAHSPYSPFIQTPSTTSVYPAQYQPAPSPRPSMGPYVGNQAMPQAGIRAPSPLTPSWSPSFAAVNGASRSPGIPMTPVARNHGVASPMRAANPTLIRTSTIQQSASGTAAGQAQPFNPYAMYPSKAVLKLNGDLNSMTENWAAEETECKRRLVQFTRHQSGSTIHGDFAPITPEERQPNSICISCIYWEGKKECFVTSVDTIYLLESLVAVRFTVEEKNRIRRNLEGFRPLTVSKAKPDSEDFFKVIMGFPNPKPRNIEKDVKVFPWKILAHALKKIIGKYSASYSSTAGALTTSMSSSYNSTSTSEASMDQQHAGSPRSVADSATSSNYSASLTSTAISPLINSAKPSPYMTAPSDLRLAVPSSQSYGAVPPSMYHLQGAGHPIPDLANNPRRASWDFSSFVDTSPATATPNNPQAIHYQRADGSAANPAFMAPYSYSVDQPTSGI